MKNHVTIAAILQIVFGAFNVLIGLSIVFIFTIAAQYVADPMVERVLALIGTPLTVVFLLFGGAMITGGIGLLSCKAWARILTLVMAAIGLLNIPFGTLKGVYVMWVLLQSETITLFDKGCPPAKPAVPKY